MLTTSPTFALTAVKYSEGRGGRRNEWGRRDPKRGARGKRERGKREGEGEGREEKWSFLSQQQAAVLNRPWVQDQRLLEETLAFTVSMVTLWLNSETIVYHRFQELGSC